MRKSITNIIFFFILVFAVLSCTRGEGKLSGITVLHNGIQLDQEWPPRYPEPLQPEEMKIPWLEKKPGTIPVNTGRQLFVDDFLIAETNLQRVIHKPRYYKGNPVLQPDQEWELTRDGLPYASPFSDGVWYDEKLKKFRMWYLAGGGLIHEGRQAFYTCYAESEDGKHWVKPPLDVYKENNIVDTCQRDAATVWLDKSETNPARRYKFFNVERRNSDSRWQFVLKYSADGIHWSRGVAQSGDMYDRSSAFYNPFTGNWVLSMRYSTGVSSRSRSYIENRDPEMLVSLAHRIRKDAEDKNVVYWFVPDNKEKRHPLFPEVKPGIYNFDGMAYESIILGFYTVWQGPENERCEELGIQKRNEISLGYSRDGFHFYRPTHDIFMGVNETEGAWNWGNVQSVNGVPLIVGDSLYFYCSGRRLNQIMWDSYTSTGLATLRRDGFASMRAGNKVATLTTEPVSFNGKYLFVNADVQGELRVEILDKDLKVIRGYSKDDFLPFSGNSTLQLLAWKGRKELSALAGKSLRLRFYLTSGDLYSFWISPWESGESRGFTAGGGPGLHESGLDVR